MTNTRGSYKMNKNTWRSSPIFLKILVNHCQPIHVHRKASDFLEPPKSRCIFHPSNWTIFSSVQDAQQKRRLYVGIRRVSPGWKTSTLYEVWSSLKSVHEQTHINQPGLFNLHNFQLIHTYPKYTSEKGTAETSLKLVPFLVSDVGHGLFGSGSIHVRFPVVKACLVDV